MVFLTDWWIVDSIIILAPVLLVIYAYFTWNYNYWKYRNVPFAKPVLGLGSFGGLLKGKAVPEIIKEIYEEFAGDRYCGFYQFRRPVLMVRDSKLIEQILIKDFSHFEDRPLPSNDNEPLTLNLSTLKGNRWRNLRHKLTPTFTSGKLKSMFDQMCNCGDYLLERIDKYAKKKETAYIKSLISTFSSDTIASCAFGLQIDSDGPEGKKFMDMVTKVTGGGSRFGALRMGLLLSFPELARLVGIRTVPIDAEKYFMSITKATIEHRTKANVKRDDFLQMLLTLKAREEAGKPDKEFDQQLIDQDDVQLKYEVKPGLVDDDSLKFTDDVIAAQTFVFLAAGADTVSTTISTVLHFLAVNSQVQSQLRDEIDKVLNSHGSWTYRAIKDMTYMDQVIQEAQRMFPIAHINVRECTTTYKVPDSDLVIEKGTMVVIPALAIHLDPANYPKPDDFDPTRFEGNNFKPSSVYLPYGDGPRICIAMRFAVLEMKVCIAKILSKYLVKPSPKTVSPLRYDPSNFNATALGGIWLDFSERMVGKKN